MNRTFFPVQPYDLGATLESGQAFRWERRGDDYEGVVAGRWVRLRGGPEGIAAACAEPVTDWGWLAAYLQTDVDLAAVLRTFPKDAALTEAVTACRGLRLLRQEPWECLASFILSSTKQIVQIRQIVDELCRRFGEPLAVPPGCAAAFAFPTAARLAACSEAELRACRMGFRAPYLRETAGRVAAGDPDPAALARLSLSEARAALLELPGVGRKIADCVLLFAYGFPAAFPIDVWVAHVLRRRYFPRRRVSLARLQAFVEGHFGPHAGYAQQYLFHFIRLQEGRARAVAPASPPSPSSP